MKCKSSDEICYDLKDGVHHFQSFFPDGGHALQQETPMIVHVLNSKDRKDLASETLSSFFVKISTVFKETKLLLQLVLTFPITSNEAERSFSQLKLLLSSRRSTMTDKRLNNLALMAVQCALS